MRRASRYLPLPLLLLSGIGRVAAHTRKTWLPREFRQLAPSQGQVGPFTVGLPISNWGVVEAQLGARSSPSSPLYGAWMSQAQVLSLIAPNPTTRAATTTYLQARGAACVDMPTALSCVAPASAVNALFQTTLYQFAQLSSNGTVVGYIDRVPISVAFSLPPQLPFVSGLYDFPASSLRAGIRGLIPALLNQVLHDVAPSDDDYSSNDTAAPPSSIDYYVAPESIQSLYNSSGLVGSAASTTGAVEFKNSNAVLQSDINAFAALTGVPAWSISQK